MTTSGGAFKLCSQFPSDGTKSLAKYDREEISGFEASLELKLVKVFRFLRLAESLRLF